MDDWSRHARATAAVADLTGVSATANARANGGLEPSITMEQADSNQPEMLRDGHLDKSGRYGKRRGPELLRLGLGLADGTRPSGRDSTVDDHGWTTEAGLKLRDKAEGRRQIGGLGPVLDARGKFRSVAQPAGSCAMSSFDRRKRMPEMEDEREESGAGQIASRW
jgi:hypothetical protein